MIIRERVFMVKKPAILLFILLFSVTFMMAQDGKARSVSANVTAQGLVGYSYTRHWYGGMDLKGVLHIDNTDFSLDFEALTEDTYSIGMTASPAFEVCRNGFVFLDGTLHSRVFSNYKTYEFVYAGSAGFRMRHFSAQFGIFAKIIDAIGRDWHSLDNYIMEPFNFLYRVKISIKGFDNPWDVYLVGSNYTDFEYERMSEPIFTLGGRCDLKGRCSVVAEGTLKPAGMLHGVVRFYEAIMRVGVSFRLE
mgnify:CR=1 FL=1